MSAKTGIEWTDSTWTPLRARRRDSGKVGVHCERVSEGCRNCYSATFNRRRLPNQGTGLDFTRDNRERVEMFLDERMLEQPVRWRKPRRIFVCSQTDLFGEFASDDQIAEVFGAMRAPHTYQVLTKRPERTLALLTDPEFRSAVEREFAIRLDGIVRPLKWPMPHLWLGVSVEDQATADERIPLLLQTPAAMRFVSAEPLLGPMDVRRWLAPCDHPMWTGDEGPVALLGRMPVRWKCDVCDVIRHGDKSPPMTPALDWLIVGGESGPGARPCDLAWIRSAVEQCKAVGVPCFVKQLGATCVGVWERDMQHVETWRDRITTEDRKGGDPAEWPADLRVREFPAVAR